VPAVLPEGILLSRNFCESKAVSMRYQSGDVEVCPLTLKSKSLPLSVPFKAQFQYKKAPLGSPESHSVVKERYR
jgi:hypothetical protein